MKGAAKHRLTRATQPLCYGAASLRIQGNCGTESRAIRANDHDRQDRMTTDRLLIDIPGQSRSTQ